MRNIGPGSYQTHNFDNKIEFKAGVSPFGVADRFYESNKNIQKAKGIPGPGQYQSDEKTIKLTNLPSTDFEKKNNSLPLFGPFKSQANQNISRNFGSTQERELKLIGNEQKLIPGPGQYNLN